MPRNIYRIHARCRTDISASALEIYASGQLHHFGHLVFQYADYGGRGGGGRKTSMRIVCRVIKFENDKSDTATPAALRFTPRVRVYDISITRSRESSLKDTRAAARPITAAVTSSLLHREPERECRIGIWAMAGS